jgi:hypothetical protein
MPGGGALRPNKYAKRVFQKAAEAAGLGRFGKVDGLQKGPTTELTHDAGRTVSSPVTQPSLARKVCSR